jgi:hypothetical protein
VDYKADIPLVNAQAESNGRNYDFHLVSHPPNLHLLSVLVAHLGMIEVAVNIIFIQFSTELFALLP